MNLWKEFKKLGGFEGSRKIKKLKTELREIKAFEFKARRVAISEDGHFYKLGNN